MIHLRTHLLMLLMFMSSCHCKTAGNVSRQGKIIQLADSDFTDCDPKEINDTGTVPPVPTDITMTRYAKRESLQCNTIIHWVQLQSMHVTSYRLKFWTASGPSCHRLSKNKRSFNFSGDGLKRTDPEEAVTFTIIAEPVDMSTVVERNYYIYCPEKYGINPLANNHEIKVGETYTFNCTLNKGFPRPDADDMEWTFNHDGGNKTVLHNNAHIEISKSPATTILTIKNAMEKHKGIYTCSFKNYMGDAYDGWSEGSLKIVPSGIKARNDLGLQIGSIFGGLLVVVILVGLAWHLIKRYYMKTDAKTIHGLRIYISHFSPCKSKKDALLKFAYCVESQLTRANVILDLTKETEIHNTGGLSHWVPEQMTLADKILVILSKEYLDVLEFNEDKDIKVENEGETTEVECGDESVLKVLAEYDYIKNMLYQHCQVTEKLLLCCQSEKPENFPSIFQGRMYHSLPKVTDGLVKDVNFIKLLSAITAGSQDTRV